MVCPVYRSVRNVPLTGKKAMALAEDRTWQAMTRARGHQNPPLRPGSRTAGFWGAIVGPKILETPAYFISSSRPMPMRKKCPRTNKEGPNCQETLPRTILFSANRNHRRRKRHATKGSFPGHPKEKHRCNETARISCHLRIKYPQLTSWPHLCEHDPWTVLSGLPQLAERQKEWLIRRALKHRHGWLTSVGPGWSKKNYIM